jgi:hypothetical protein
MPLPKPCAEMIKEGVLARQSGELVLVNPAAQ